MKRYARSSQSDEALAQFSTDAIHILQDGVSTGRVFWLKNITITNSHATETDVVQIYDSTTEGASPTATLERLEIFCPAANTVSIDFGGPGIKFITGMIAGTTGTTGTFPAYGVTVSGYEQ